MSEKRQRTELVVIRLLPEEHASLIIAAHQRGITVSALIRDRLRQVIGSSR